MESTGFAVSQELVDYGFPGCHGVRGSGGGRN